MPRTRPGRSAERDRDSAGDPLHARFKPAQETVTVHGRSVVVRDWGRKSDYPVFVLHGTPGSHAGVAPRPSVLYRQGIRLITYDRPGYGYSHRQIGRTVASAAEDVRAIARHLGLRRFAVAGRSGGGPHALACAALLPDLVSRVTALVSLAPRVGGHGMGDRWFHGMSESNTKEYDRAIKGIGTLTPELRRRAAAIKKNPDALIVQILEEVQAADREVMSDAGIRQMLRDNYTEALRQDGDGWIDDAMAFVGDWGFRLDEISVPVLLWHGQHDVFSPIQHSEWLAHRTPGAVLRVGPGQAHFDALHELLNLFSWLSQPDPPRSPDYQACNSRM